MEDIDIDSILDKDVAQLGTNLKNSLTEVILSSVNHMTTVKERLLAEQEATLKQRDSFYMAQLQRQQETIDSLNERLAKLGAEYDKEVERQEAIADNSADAWNRKHRLHSGDFAQRKAFIGWKDVTFESKRSAQLEHVAHALYEKSLKSKAFSTFVRLFARNAINREKAKAVREHEIMAKRIIEKYELALGRARQESEDAHRVASVEQMRRKQLEEDLRRTFLKNMTNMNMEALALFHNNAASAQAAMKAPSSPMASDIIGTSASDETPRTPQDLPTPVPYK